MRNKRLRQNRARTRHDIERMMIYLRYRFGYCRFGALVNCGIDMRLTNVNSPDPPVVYSSIGTPTPPPSLRSSVFLSDDPRSLSACRPAFPQTDLHLPTLRLQIPAFHLQHPSANDPPSSMSAFHQLSIRLQLRGYDQLRQRHAINGFGMHEWRMCCRGVSR